jgi:heptosyltransferase-2
MATGKILVIRGGAIGDFIVTLPVLSALRAQFPQARLEVLGYGHIAQLAVAGCLADAVRPIEARALAGFFARGGALDERLKLYFAEFAVLLSYLYDPDGIFRENISRCTGAQFIVGPHRPDDHGGVPASEVLLKPLERLAIFDADPVPRLNLAHLATQNGLARNDRSVDQGKSRRWLAAHPGSGSERKNWPESNWAELLAQAIDGMHCNILLVGGEAEGRRLDRLMARLPSEHCRLAQSLPLTDLALLLRQCDFFIGHDSGISHLAAALGLPGVVLWGNSVEAVWRPQSERIGIVRDPSGLAHLPVPRVLEVLAQTVSHA